MFLLFKKPQNVIELGNDYSQTKFQDDMFIFNVFIALYVGKVMTSYFQIRFLRILIVVRLNKWNF